MSVLGKRLIGLDPELLADAFPFHLVIDEALAVVQVGATLAKLDASLSPCTRFEEAFVMRRPELELAQGGDSPFWRLAALAGRLVLIEHRATGLLLRGQFVRRTNVHVIVFLGSPWLVDPNQLAAYGLKISDFAVHDPVVDLLQIVQVHRTTVDDVKQLAVRLSLQRTELEEKNRALINSYAAAQVAERRLALQYAVVRSLAASDSVNDAVENILRNVGETLGWQVGLAWLIDRNRGEMRLTATWTVPELADHAIVRRAPRVRAFGQGPSGAVWKSGVPLFIRDAAADHRYPRSEDARGAGIRSCLWLPLKSGEMVLGVIALFSAIEMEEDPGIEQAMDAITRSFTQFLGRKAHEDALSALTETLNAILELAPDGFVAFDPHGARTYANSAFFELVGLDRSAITPATVGEFDSLLAGLCTRDAQYVPVSGMIANHADTLELVKPRPRVLARAVRRMAQHPRNSGFVVYLRDITSEREVDRMKSEFLSTAAHELRTPTSGLLGYTELLLTREFPAAVSRDILETMHRQSSQLVTIVNDLLDLARIEARAGKDLKIRRQPVTPIVRNALELLLIPGDPRKVSLSLPKESPCADVDADKLAQALTNVLSNAYKYSAGRGEIRLALQEAERDGRRWIVLSVTDEGIGMTPDQLARIFERFYRADPSGAIPGTGLGMSLVREFIGLMQGEVEVQSEPGRGTIVTIWLRAAPD